MLANLLSVRQTMLSVCSQHKLPQNQSVKELSATQIYRGQCCSQSGGADDDRVAGVAHC